MKCSKSITVLGNYSGRNAGDAAILEGIFSDISELHPVISFEVPTINPIFIHENHSNYSVQIVPKSRMSEKYLKSA